MLGFTERNFLVRKLFCFLLLGTVFACPPANAGLLDRGIIVGNYVKGIVTESLDVFKEGFDDMLSGEVEYATINRRANDLYRNSAREGVESLTEIVSDGVNSISTGVKSVAGKIAEKFLGKAASIAADKISKHIFSDNPSGTNALKTPKAIAPVQNELRVNYWSALNVNDDVETFNSSESTFLDEPPLSKNQIAAYGNENFDATTTDYKEEAVQGCANVWNSCTETTPQPAAATGHEDTRDEYGESLDPTEYETPTDSFNEYQASEGSYSYYDESENASDWDNPEVAQGAQDDTSNEWDEYSDTADDSLYETPTDSWNEYQASDGGFHDEYYHDESENASDWDNPEVAQGTQDDSSNWWADYSDTSDDSLNAEALNGPLSQYETDDGGAFEEIDDYIDSAYANDDYSEILESSLEEPDAEPERFYLTELEKLEEEILNQEQMEAEAAAERERLEAERLAQEEANRQSGADTGSSGGVLETEGDGICGSAPACKKYIRHSEQVISQVNSISRRTGLTDGSLKIAFAYRSTLGCMRKCLPLETSSSCKNMVQSNISELEMVYRSAIARAKGTAVDSSYVDEFDRNPGSSQFVRNFGLHVSGASLDSCGD